MTPAVGTGPVGCEPAREEIDALVVVARRDEDPVTQLDRMYERVLAATRTRPTAALTAARHLRDAVRREHGRRAGGLALPLARAQRLYAHSLRATGQVARAAEAYARAWDLLLPLKIPAESARTAIGWVDALALAGRLDEAGRVAASGRRCAPHDRTLRAKLDSNLANGHYLAGRLNQAARGYRSAYVALRHAGRPTEAALAGFNLGNIELLRGRTTVARRLYADAAHRLGRTGQHVLRLHAEYGVVRTQIAEEAWDPAWGRLQAIERQLEARGDARGAAALQDETAQLLSAVGAVELAEVAARGAVRSYQEAGLTGEAARAMLHHGRLLLMLGRPHDARHRLEACAEWWRQQRNRRAVHLANLELARACMMQGDPLTARGLVRNVMRYFGDRDRDGQGARALALQAELDLAAGFSRSAVSAARSAYTTATRYPMRTERPWMALLIAEGLMRMGSQGAALRWARRAVAELEGLRGLLGSRRLRAETALTRDRFCQRLLDILPLDGVARQVHASSKLVLRVRAAELSDGLARRSTSQRQARLRTAIARLRDASLGISGAEAPHDPRVPLRETMDNLERQLFRGKSASRTPSSHQPSEPVRRRKLDRERAWVAYHRDSRRWWAIVQEPGRARRAVALSDAAAALRSAWTPLELVLEAAASAPPEARAALLERTRETAAHSLQALHAALWAPLGVRSRQVAIVPSGELAGVPLEAMIQVGGQSAGGAVAGAHDTCRLLHPWAATSLRRRRSGRALLLHGAGRGMQDEVERVAQVLIGAGYQVRIGSQRRSLLSTRAPVDVVHVAAHGHFHREAWLLAGIQLRDGWLGPEHLVHPKLRGALIYLSSCESGRTSTAAFAGADGWLGAGLGAHVAQLVVSLWRIDDASASRFATDFYSQWTRAASPAVAVSSAQRSAAGSNQHPYAWAGFCAIG